MPNVQPIIPLSTSQTPYFFGVDVGGTNIKIGLVDDVGQTLGFEEIETREADGPIALPAPASAWPRLRA
jgi:glucokinase